MVDLVAFFTQFWVLIAMIVGMFVGEYFTQALFGGIRGGVKQIVHLLFFACLLTLGGYLPELFSLPYLGFERSLLLYGVWGLVSVFVSRIFLFLLEFSVSRLRRRRKHQPSVDIRALFCFLSDRRIDPEPVFLLLSEAFGSADKAKAVQKKAKSGRLRGRVPMSPERLSAASCRQGLSSAEVVEMLVSSFGFSPELAARIWRESSRP